jgi:hypothetical protein
LQQAIRTFADKFPRNFGAARLRSQGAADPAEVKRDG